MSPTARVKAEAWLRDGGSASGVLAWDRSPRAGRRTKRVFWPHGVPRGAVVSPTRGAVSGTDYEVAGRLVARVYLHASGAVDWETRYDSAGRLHGVEKQDFEDGSKKYRARWVHGLQQGLQQQWDRSGRLVVETRFVRGTGVDLWVDCGRVSEERHFVAGQRHGVERWWRDARRLWSEAWFVRGVAHGPERAWNGAGRLRRGFPKYFVNGRKVRRREYERAAGKDPTLPRIRAADDRGARAFNDLDFMIGSMTAAEARRMAREVAAQRRNR